MFMNGTKFYENHVIAFYIIVVLLEHVTNTSFETANLFLVTDH